MTGFPTRAGDMNPVDYGRRGGAGQGDDPIARSRIMFALFLAAATMIFALLVSALLVRRDLGWQSAPLPSLLWVSTALLAAASAVLESSARRAQRGDRAGALTMLWWAGGVTAAFVAGQLAAWGQMLATGYAVATNAFSSFFYLITFIHGLHVLGGLVAWGWLLLRVRAAAGGGAGEVSGVGPALRLCAAYWHFLLAVWILMFALMLLS